MVNVHTQEFSKRIFKRTLIIVLHLITVLTTSSLVLDFYPKENYSKTPLLLILCLIKSCYKSIFLQLKIRIIQMHNEGR